MPATIPIVPRTRTQIANRPRAFHRVGVDMWVTAVFKVPGRFNKDVSSLNSAGSDLIASLVDAGDEGLTECCRKS